MYYVQAQPAVPASTAPHFRTAKEPNKALTWTTSTTYSRATRTNDNENTRERRCHHLVFGCISRVPPSLSFLFSQSLYCLLSRYSHTHMHTYIHTHTRAPPIPLPPQWKHVSRVTDEGTNFRTRLRSLDARGAYSFLSRFSIQSERNPILIPT